MLQEGETKCCCFFKRRIKKKAGRSKWRVGQPKTELGGQGVRRPTRGVQSALVDSSFPPLTNSDSDRLLRSQSFTRSRHTHAQNAAVNAHALDASLYKAGQETYSASQVPGHADINAENMTAPKLNVWSWKPYKIVKSSMR